MIITIVKKSELKDGRYSSIISDIREYPEKNACLVKLDPFDDKGEYKEVSLWINAPCEDGTVGYRFLEALGISDEEEVDTDSLKSEFLDSYIGIVIKNNEKNGIVYHNIVDFFEVDIEDNEDENDSDEEEEELEDEDEEDDFEDFDRPTSRRSGSKTIPRREEKRSKTNRR